ncbi:MAG: tetrathionate reductase family octaheme c-type cytochrome [Desulfacinum sp.]|nr:tetrathionate reductase family octaheme c-type cytochrome [Desulfacinum sp.]
MHPHGTRWRLTRFPALALAFWVLFTPHWVGAAAEADPEKQFPYGIPYSPNNTADHSKFKELQKEFSSPEEVTRACLGCHTEAAAQIHKTIHWTWLCPAAKPEAKLGKGGDVINNFCISIHSNEPRCTSCHIGYGWKDKNFDFSRQDKVDCLVCHEQTGTYKKFPTAAGYPVAEPTEFGGKTFLPPEWNKVAQSVGRPTRKNCGTCHFFGGGGEGVKHGDLDASLFSPKKALDVHMDAEGLNFTCTRCHTTEQHAVSGRCYKSSEIVDRRSLLDYDQIKRITCYACHSETPHKNHAKANDHTDKVACQTCHIPAIAREHSTKMYWDWSQAGERNEKGKPVVKKKDGRIVYDGKKGAFRWEKNVVPEYFWFNGRIQYLTLTEKVDPSQNPVQLNRPMGSYDDPNARIYPFKVHRGKQPYDPVHKTLIVPHLFGKDPAAYWKSYDWQKAAEAGMEYVGLPFSGQVDFIETQFVFQSTHMVAPKEQALSCVECHSPNGRLKNLKGFYVPGRDSHPAVDALGWGGMLAALVAVLAHGGARFFSNGRRKGR